jgi:hypothetical protein
MTSQVVEGGDMRSGYHHVRYTEKDFAGNRQAWCSKLQIPHWKGVMVDLRRVQHWGSDTQQLQRFHVILYLLCGYISTHWEL